MTHDKPWREQFAALVNDYQGAFGGGLRCNCPPMVTSR